MGETPGVKARDIVYISTFDTSEQDLIDGLLELAFGRNVMGYVWEVPELRENCSDANPCCVIISQPMERQDIPTEEMWGAVKEIFPEVPVIWLAPEEEYLPDFLPAENDSLRVLISSSGVNHGDVLRNFVKLVGEVICAQPSISLS